MRIAEPGRIFVIARTAAWCGEGRYAPTADISKMQANRIASMSSLRIRRLGDTPYLTVNDMLAFRPVCIVDRRPA
jgi:hypothetical protein